MKAEVLSGTLLSKQIKSEIAVKIQHHIAQGKRKPGLAFVILVGMDPASQIYVGSKRKSCGRDWYLFKIL